MEEFAPPLTDRCDWALFLDVDGTLIDIAPAPDEVVVPGDLAPLLESIAAGLSGAVALVSGRRLADVERLFPLGLGGAGVHGAEWRLPGGAVHREGRWSAGTATAVAAEAGGLPGVMVEDKGLAVALHFRRVPEQAPAAIALAEAAMAAAAPPLRLLRGKAVVELIPADAGKGRAIARFMGHAPFAGRIPVFVGDDVTDEDGFEAVNRMGGVSIHVGAAATAARYRLASPEAVRHWLHKLDAMIGGSAGR